jgi:hypothetical protein
MKKTTYIILSLLLSLFSLSAFADADGKIYVDGKHAKNVDYVFVGQNVKVEVRAQKKESRYVQGAIEKTKQEFREGRSVTLEYRPTKLDLLRGYVIVQVFFQKEKGQAVTESFVKTITVTSPDKLAKEANMTDEQRMEQLFGKNWKKLNVDDTVRGRHKEKDLDVKQRSPSEAVGGKMK